MTLLQPNLKSAPGGHVVYSSLYDSTDPAQLTQDLLLVSLPGDTYVDVSWSPEHDAEGHYYVTVLRQHSELITVPCRDPHRAIEIVEELAERYTGGNGGNRSRAGVAWA
jgi:hypothetical protein